MLAKTTPMGILCKTSCNQPLGFCSISHKQALYAIDVTTMEPIKDFTVLDGLFSDYLKKKHTRDHIIGVVNDLIQNYKQIHIDNIIVTDNQIIDLNLTYLKEGSKKNLFMRLIFDDEDNYRIKMLMYNTRSR